MDRSFYNLSDTEQCHTPPPLPVPPYQPPREAESGPEPRKPQRWPWIILLCLLCTLTSYTVGYSVGANSHPATIVMNPTNATSAPIVANMTTKWMNTHTFKGNGPQQTETFVVANEWKLSWTCTPHSSPAGQYNIIATIYNVDGSIRDGALNSVCKPGVTSGSTYEHQDGSIYLDLEITGNYTVTVQELK